MLKFVPAEGQPHNIELETAYEVKLEGVNTLRARTGDVK